MSEITRTDLKLIRKSSLLEREFEAAAADVAAVTIKRAKAGDTVCLKLMLERLLPIVRERSISIDLPTVNTINDLPPAVAAILSRVADGSITPSEGEKLASLLGSWRESVEVTELLRRIAALEERSAGKVAL